jgi:nicotinamide mononucleotide adenylyltransferase
MAKSVGVVHGRFQPFHLEHLIYVMEAFKRCDFLFIGITNPDREEMVFHTSDPNRSLDTSNPLTFWQRVLLIEAGLREAGVPPNKFCIVPFPLNRAELLKYYVPLDARFYMTIYDDWGREKRDLLISLGLDVEVLWERDLTHKSITATMIRQRIAAGEPWEELVPKAVAETMKEMALDAKIRDMMRSEKS